MAVYKDAVGLPIALECGTDITAATTRQIKYRKPDGTTGTWTAVQATSTKISYTTVAGDMNFSGDIYLQAYVVTPSWTLYGDITWLTVLDIL